MVGTTKYSPQSSWTLGDKEYAPDIYDDAHNNYKDSLLVSDSAFNTDGIPQLRLMQMEIIQK